MREITLDTETTGFYAKNGDRIIEIGCVELSEHGLSNNKFHVLINPERKIEASAIEVHRITNEMLVGKPLFADIADQFIDFIKGATLIIHNAPFDVGFIDEEFRRIGKPPVSEICQVVDSLELAKAAFPQVHNSLDALCKRYGISIAKREEEGHGALLDAELLAQVYLALRQSQGSLEMDSSSTGGMDNAESRRKTLRVVKATAEELEQHEKTMEMVRKASGNQALYDIDEETFNQKRAQEKDSLAKKREKIKELIASL